MYRYGMHVDIGYMLGGTTFQLIKRAIVNRYVMNDLMTFCTQWIWINYTLPYTSISILHANWKRNGVVFHLKYCYKIVKYVSILSRRFWFVIKKLQYKGKIKSSRTVFLYLIIIIGYLKTTNARMLYTKPSHYPPLPIPSPLLQIHTITGRY